MFNILVVDDENLIRYSLTMTFKKSNISVKTAATGLEAIRAIRAERFDICFLDLHLPDMGGIEILKELIAISPDTKVIIMSGDILASDARDIIRKHAVLFLEKPFDLEQAKSIVNLILARIATVADTTHLHPAGSATFHDRRRYIRYSAGKNVLYSAMAPEGEPKAVNVEASLRDISDAGMGLFSHQPVEPGWVVTVFDGEVVNMGTVRWLSSLRPHGPFTIGLQFNA